MAVSSALETRPARLRWSRALITSAVAHGAGVGLLLLVGRGAGRATHADAPPVSFVAVSLATPDEDPVAAPVAPAPAHEASSIVSSAASPRRARAVRAARSRLRAGLSAPPVLRAP